MCIELSIANWKRRRASHLFEETTDADTKANQRSKRDSREYWVRISHISNGVSCYIHWLNEHQYLEQTVRPEGIEDTASSENLIVSVR